jgi:glycosyltransferase involved in cell wall biosynthesis
MVASSNLPDGSPLVSIVTPSYNQSEFIEETIQSVARQQYPNVEHIVVDGDSDDGTVEILEEYDDQIKWLSEPDDGQSDAINKGFEMAEGDLVGWINSDDVLFDTGVIERVVEYFREYDASLIYGDMALLNPSSGVLKLQVVPDFDHDQLLVKCFIEQPALFFRGHVVNEERLNTDLEYVMDYEFWLRLAKEYEFHHVSDVLAGDRNHSERKILNQRDAMQAEAEQIRAEYGGSTGSDRVRQSRFDLVVSGIPRAAIAGLRTIDLHRNPPDLAFDGGLRPLPKMLLNTARKNKNLV